MPGWAPIKRSVRIIEKGVVASIMKSTIVIGRSGIWPIGIGAKIIVVVDVDVDIVAANVHLVACIDFIARVDVVAAIEIVVGIDLVVAIGEVGAVVVARSGIGGGSIHGAGP